MRTLAGIVHDYLKNFLEANLPKVKEGKKAKFILGIGDPKLGAQLNELLGVTCENNEVVQELIRGYVTWCRVIWRQGKNNSVM